MKRLAILGSTGSIGRQTLDIVRSLQDRFEVVGLAGGSNLELLSDQIAEFKPRMVYCLRDDGLADVPTTVRRVSLTDMTTHPDVDLVVVATAGKAGLSPTMAALSVGKTVALANKEVLVMAGHIVAAAVAKGGGTIYPIDSEHSALWQCLVGEIPDLRCCPPVAQVDKGLSQVSRLILTASGGAFRHLGETELITATAEQALAHPVWNMGKKITIDCASMMNKGLEVIEAHWLFGIPYSQINVIVHYESMIHSMVEFVDGSVKAQLGVPDMRLPIQYALTFPERIANPDIPRLDIASWTRFNFISPDFKRFPCLQLAFEAGAKGGTYPAVLCAADEVAVSRFLDGEIGFMQIPSLIENVLSRHSPIETPSLDEVVAVDEWAREEATHWLSR